MRWVIALFVSAVLGTAAVGGGFALWAAHHGRHDNLRVIHYDTKYDLSAQRRIPAE